MFFQIIIDILHSYGTETPQVVIFCRLIEMWNQNTKIGLFHSLLFHDSLVYHAVQVDHVSMHYFIVSFLANTDTFHYMMSKNIFVNASDLIRKFFKGGCQAHNVDIHFPKF